MKYIILLFTFTLMSCSNGQKESDIEGLTIDPNIKNDVEKYIADLTQFDQYADLMQIYSNSLYVESFENDSLVITSTDFSRKLPFKSFYIWNKDTLGINGAYGLFGGTGFYIEIVDNKAELFHLLSSDDFPTYAYQETDSLIMRLEVPCLETKIVLSEIPDSTKDQLIYGLVEFKSNTFYSVSGVFLEGEEPKKKKMRNNMKIYFRSGLLKMDEKPADNNG